MRAALVLAGLGASAATEGTQDPSGALSGNGEYTHGEVDFESQFYPDNLVEDYTFWYRPTSMRFNSMQHGLA